MFFVRDLLFATSNWHMIQHVCSFRRDTIGPFSLQVNGLAPHLQTEGGSGARRAGPGTSAA